jgi:hypothetical protein
MTCRFGNCARRALFVLSKDLGKDDFQQAQRCLLSVSLRLLSHEYRSSGATAGIIIYDRE